jgi:hypothetical protein
MDPARAAALTTEWTAAHTREAPSEAAAGGIRHALATRVPEPAAAAAITDPDGRVQVAALAGAALFLVWAVPGAAGIPEATRTRRIPLAPGTAVVEVSERAGPPPRIRHWWFALGDEPLVFRTTGDDPPEELARALAGAVGWTL